MKENVKICNVLNELTVEEFLETYSENIQRRMSELGYYVQDGFICIDQEERMKKVFEKIDKAIAKYKEITNTDSSCPAHCNISCDKCVQESRQLVEWLEELKTYRECNVCEYNKAIDDFVNQFNVIVDEKCGTDTNNYFRKIVKEIAEQLKAGEDNV